MFRNFKTIFILLVAVIIAALVYYSYKRSKPKKQEVNSEVSVQKENENQNLITVFRKEYDLEKLDGIENAGLVTKAKACSGMQSTEMNPEIEYGINLLFPLDIIPGGTNIIEAKISAAVWTEDAGDAQWVLEVRDPDQKTLFWNSALFTPGKHVWDTLDFSFQLPPEFLNRANSFKFYPWNKSFKSIWVDNICVNFIGTAKGRNGKRVDYKSVNYFLNYEEESLLTDQGSLTDERARSGTHSTVVRGNNSYSNSFGKIIREISDDTLRRVSLVVWIYPQQRNPSLTLVVTVKNASGETVFWDGKSSEKLEFAAGEWQKFTAEILIPPDKRKLIKSTDEVVVYLWNRSSIKVFADDLEIVYGDESARPGLLPFADMNLSSRESYSFDRLHGPYRINYLENISLNNKDYLASDGTEKFGKLFPDDEIILLKSKIGQEDLLLHLRGNAIEMFRWCEKNSAFVLLGRSKKMTALNAGTIIYAFDSDGDGNSEVLAINDHKGSLISLSPESYTSCTNNYSALTNNILWEGEIDSNSYHLVDDFSGDGKDEWLSVNMDTQTWQLKIFQNDHWVVKGNGVFPANSFSSTSAICSGNFIPANKKTQLLLSYRDNSKNVSVIYEYNSTAENFRQTSGTKESYLTQIFSPGMKLFKTNIDGDLQDEILTFNHDWRFNMKIVDCDARGFYVLSALDFKGYQNSCNPKFYEVSKPIVGNLTGAKNDNLMMVLRNCADKKFDGSSCVVYGGSPDLPDQIQMYFLKIF